MNPRVLALLAVLLVGVLVVALYAVRTEAPPSAASPTPTASPTSTALPSPTVVASATPPATASPTASPVAGRFVNAALGYSLELTQPWRWSGCFSHSPGEFPQLGAVDTFLTVPAYDEQAGHTGIPHGLVEVRALPNDERLTPRQWFEAGRSSPDIQGPAEDRTFAGRNAVRLAADGFERYIVANEDTMFEITGRPGSAGGSPENTVQQRFALISSFRFLTAEELAAARSAATPAPAARTPQQVAEALADGFARKDIGLLGTVADRYCMQQAVVPGGGSATSTQRFLDDLRDRFARGLSVTVSTRTPTQAPGLDNPNMVVGGVWKEPGQPDVEVDLLISREAGERWAWSHVLFYTTGRP